MVVGDFNNDGKADIRDDAMYHAFEQSQKNEVPSSKGSSGGRCGCAVAIVLLVIAAVFLIKVIMD